MDFNRTINQLDQDYFYKTFKKFNATDEQIDALNKKFPTFKTDAIKLKLEDKLNLAYIFGFDIDDIIKTPYFLFKPFLTTALKCEIALLEGFEPDLNFLSKSKHRHLFSNYTARKKGYLPENYNVLIDAYKSSKLLKLSKNNFINKFYKDKNISDIHNEFKSVFPDFFDELMKIDEFKILVNTKDKRPAINNTNPKRKPTKPHFSIENKNVCYSTEKFEEFAK